MRLLVTGGAGFIGSSVVKHFVALGHEVVVADRFTYAGKGRNLQPVLKEVRLLIGDLASGDLALRCAAMQSDWVVHLAAETHVDRAIADPEAFMWSNVVGTTRLLQALYAQTETSSAMPRKIILYSTDEVYGPTPPGVLFDEHAPFRPSNAYSASKVGVEGVAHAFWMTHGLPIVVVRPCNTYGPHQHPEKVIPKFVRQLLTGEVLTVYNDGKGSRDWLHVADHARAIETVLRHGMPGQAYNLAAGEEHTDLAIAERIFVTLGLGDVAEFYHTDAFVRYQPGRPGHDRRYAMDGRKLRALGWAPQVPFDDGFRDTVLWNAHHLDWWAVDSIEVP